MDIQATKIKLAKMILETEDISLIEKMDALVHDEDELTSEQKAAIEEALEEFEQGLGIPHEVVMQEMKERYPQYFSE